ncbi:MAG: hypothetical protein A2Y12_11150 [Planctomycetes bacterium GWF2_42_9]|nr:MAG: hypothetical protein A2Y12_11150 [Planctomycetes bacterium GWF2_42_9]
MLLNSRQICTSVSVLGFFCVAIIGWFSGLSQFTCCKRALLAAVMVYVGTSIALKAVNAILTDALINSQIKQQKEQVNDSRNG